MSDHSRGRLYRVPQGEGIARDPVADQVLLVALDGVDLDATPAATLALSKKVVDALDPITLLDLGCPDNEYDPEVDLVAALAAQGRLTPDTAWAVFGSMFAHSSLTPARGDAIWAALTDQITKQQGRGKTMTQGRLAYSITRTDPDGRWVSNELRRDQRRWTLWRSTDTTTQSFPVDLDTTDPIQVIATTPVLHRIGTEITEISFNARISNHDLLGVLRVDRPSARPPRPERWVDDVEDWATQDEWITRGSVPDGSTIVPRWISINAHRAAVLRGRRRSAVVLFDADFAAPVVTFELLRWGFYTESGTPMTWSGHATFGWCGPRVWVLNRVGDIDPGWSFEWAPPESLHVKHLTDRVLAEGWVLPFLRSAVGFPGLTDAEVAEFAARKHIEGQWLDSDLHPQIEEGILRRLMRLDPEWGDAITALKDPESTRGRAVYGWLRVLATGEPGASSWNHVDHAIIGDLDEPGDDVRAPTLAERWSATVAGAEAVIDQAMGWAPALDLDEEHLDRVRAVATQAHDLGLLTAAVAEYQSRLESLPGDKARARALLGVQPGDSGTAIWRAYERCSAEDPEQERAYYDAYQILHNPPTTVRMEELTTALRQAQAAQQAADDLGWPDQWSTRWAGLWRELGGTGDSAWAWADTGWAVETVLGEAHLHTPWNGPISERVRNTAPPAPGSTHGGGVQ